MTDRAPLTADEVAVLIPALNESLRIREVVSGALAHHRHVIVVDDGSDDDTAGWQGPCAAQRVCRGARPRPARGADHGR
jgi:hypothetical protein